MTPTDRRAVLSEIAQLQVKIAWYRGQVEKHEKELQPLLAHYIRTSFCTKDYVLRKLKIEERYLKDVENGKRRLTNVSLSTLEEL